MIRYILIILTFFSSALQAQDVDVLKHLKVLSSDEMEGRGFGEKGNFKAQDYIEEQFKILNLKPAFGESYKQAFTHKGKKGNNVAVMVPGQTEKIIVVTAHLDHLGVKNDKIYNGADDDASGTAALFAIADHFKNNSNKHTIVVAAVDAEEIGSIGAQYMLDNFPLPQENIVLNVNLDMIAHNNENTIYACGTYFYPQLKAPLEQLDSEVVLKFGHDSPEYKGSDNWTFASDHRVFHRKKIPFIYFGVEDHKDYHQPSDVFENINADFYLDVVDLVIKSIEAYDKAL